MTVSTGALKDHPKTDRIDDHGENDDQEQVLTFALESEVFAIKVIRVQEILDIVPVTIVPNADPFAPGIINVRGNVVPLVDLRHRFGMAPKPPGTAGRTVVLDAVIDEETTRVALTVDAVRDVVPVETLGLTEIPGIGTRWNRDYVQGITRIDDQLTIVLDLDAVFNLDADGSALQTRGDA